MNTSNSIIQASKLGSPPPSVDIRSKSSSPGRPKPVLAKLVDGAATSSIVPDDNVIPLSIPSPLRSSAWNKPKASLLQIMVSTVTSA